MEDSQFPNYPPPGPPVADSKQSGPLTKMLTKMIAPKLKSRLMGKPRAKGLQSNQNVKIGHKKVKFY